VADHIWAVILIMLLAGGVKFALALLYVDGRPVGRAAVSLRKHCHSTKR
jgi:hypothetical protein